MNVINHIRSNFLLKNEKCSIAKAIEILAVHYGNGNGIVHKGVQDGIIPYYYNDDQMDHFKNLAGKIKKDPTNYNNMRLYGTLEEEIRKIMVSRNELEEEISLLNTSSRQDGIIIMNEYINILDAEYQDFKKNGENE